MRNVSNESSREKRDTHFMFNKFYSKIVPFMDVGKYCRAGQSTDGNMGHAHCMPYA